MTKREKAKYLRENFNEFRQMSDRRIIKKAKKYQRDFLRVVNEKGKDL